MPLVRKTFCHPIQFRDALNESGEVIRNENGRAIQETVPGHPTRLVRTFEINTWEEEVEDGAAR